MTGDRKHASPDELASLALGVLRSRKAARIGAHVAGCERCAEVRQWVDAVPATLASAVYPPMPTALASRIEVAISDEARRRLAAWPATEADRGALPVRRRRTVGQRGWRPPGPSVRAIRLAAAAAAVVLAGVGSYLAVANTGGQGTAHSTSGAAAAPAAPQQMQPGPEVTYGQPGALHAVHSVRSSTNFNPAHLSSEVIDAVHAAAAHGASAAAPSASRSATAPLATGIAGPNSPSPGQLSSCLSGLVADRMILLVDFAKYEGRPATIVVVAATAVRQAEVWVVGTACSATNTDVLAHAVLGHV